MYLVILILTHHIFKHIRGFNIPHLWPWTWHHHSYIPEYFCLNWYGSWSVSRSWLCTVNCSILQQNISSQHLSPWFLKSWWGTKTDQSTVDAYGSISHLYIFQICIWLIFCFTDSIRRKKNEQSNVATYGGRNHVYIYIHGYFYLSYVFCLGFQ